MATAVDYVADKVESLEAHESSYQTEVDGRLDTLEQAQAGARVDATKRATTISTIVAAVVAAIGAVVDRTLR